MYYRGFDFNKLSFYEILLFLSAIMFIFLDLLLVEQIFLSPQVKLSVIINKLVYSGCLTSFRTTYDLGS